VVACLQWEAVLVIGIKHTLPKQAVAAPVGRVNDVRRALARQQHHLPVAREGSVMDGRELSEHGRFIYHLGGVDR